MQRCTFSLKVCLAATILPSLGACGSNEKQYVDNFSQALAALDWGEGTTTYVIGHKSPDTDAVCSAITYAYLMNALGYSCEPRVAGKLNNETKMVLKRFGVAEPQLLENAGLMLSALLSDTNNMTSTTVTAVDSAMYAELLPLTGIADANSYYEEMTDSLASYTGMTDEEIFFSDYKDYGSESVGCDMGGAVVNSLDESSQVSLRKRMLSFMPTALLSREREMVFAMILNKTANYTDIIYCGEGAKEAAEAAFGQSDTDYIRCQGQLSRKNDFIPAISKVCLTQP